MLEARLVCEVSLVVMALLYLCQAARSATHSDNTETNRQLGFLGRKIFLENMALCPSRVCFLLSCFLLQVN